MKDNLTRDEIENLIYDEDLNFQQLLEIKKQMKKFDFERDDYQYVDEMLEDCYDVMSLTELENALKIIKTNNLNDNIIEKYFRRKSEITETAILKMNNDDIEYIINEGNLSLEMLLFIKSILFKIDIDEDTIDELNKQIDYELEDICKFEELENIERLFEKYGFPTSKFSKLKTNLKNELKNGSNDSLLQKLDNYIENMPTAVLEEMQKQAKENNNIEDYMYYSGRLKNKEQLVNNHDELNNNLNKIEKKGFFASLFSSKNKKILTNIKQEEIRNTNYEPYQFEEEELEEDDYYYEDDKN